MEQYKQINSKGHVYYLHVRTMPTRVGIRHLYYFARQINPDRVATLPAGYEPMETKYGMLLLRKVRTIQ